jgi:hypothetical protein
MPLSSNPLFAPSLNYGDSALNFVRGLALHKASQFN